MRQRQVVVKQVQRFVTYCLISKDINKILLKYSQIYIQRSCLGKEGVSLLFDAKLNLRLFQTQMLILKRFSLDMFHCIRFPAITNLLITLKLL
jgi:hypothetical protein